MRKTGAVTQKVPSFSSDDYKTFTIGDFKGIDKSVNPFNAIADSAEECLNLYVDDEGTLTTRPRLEYLGRMTYSVKKWYPVGNSKFWGTTSDNAIIETSDFKTFKKYGITNEGTTTISDIFTTNDKIYAIVNDSLKHIYQASFSTVTIRDPDIYIPNTGAYDSATDTRTTTGEPRNRLTDKFETSVWWSPAKMENLAKLDFELVKNDYYKPAVRLNTYTKVKYYPESNRIVGSNDGSTFVVLDTSGTEVDRFTRPSTTTSYKYDFDYDAASNTLLVAYILNGSLDAEIMHDSIAEPFFQGVANPSNAVEQPCCCITKSGYVVAGWAGAGTQNFQVWYKTTTDLLEYLPTGNTFTRGIYKTPLWMKACPALNTATGDPAECILMGYRSTIISAGFVKLVGIYISTKESVNFLQIDVGDKQEFVNYFSLYATDEKTYISTTDGRGYKLLLEPKDANIRSVPNNTNITYDDGTGLQVVRTSNTAKNLRYQGKIYANLTGVTAVTGSTEIESVVLFADGSVVDSDGFLYRYEASTYPQMVIQETSTDEIEMPVIEYVARYNNNYVYWSSNSNLAYFTAYNNPTYIPKSYYDDYGNSDPITSVIRITDTYLAMLKENSTHLAWYDSDNDRYLANELRTEKGNIAINQAIVCNYSNIPMCIQPDGFYALGQSSSVNYQDTVYTAMSDSIRVEVQKLDLSKCKTHNHKFLTYFVNYDETLDETRIYVFDNRLQMWFKWTVPIEVITLAELNDVTYLTDSNNNVYRFTVYADRVNGDLNTAEYVDNIAGTKTHIPWLWVSQPLYLRTLNYRKRLRYMKFLFNNKYESDDVTLRYGFLTYKQSERPTKLREYTSPFTRNEFSNEVTGIAKEVSPLKTRKIRPYIPSFDFIQIILRSNNDEEIFEDEEGNLVPTTLNDKIGLIGIAINYILQEG